jgi:hypothetical protein
MREWFAKGLSLAGVKPEDVPVELNIRGDFFDAGQIARATRLPEHDPDKWTPVFRKDHAQRRYPTSMIQLS